jgi:hypothetical protein|nr:hypothetical protein [Kofleriaceae bacterium]
MPIEYKFVELSIVTDETIQDTVNTFVRAGWHWDGIRFVTTDSSRRPQMAFVSFIREVPDGERPKAEAKAEAKADTKPGPRLVTD